jgi:hypothetical protein
MQELEQIKAKRVTIPKSVKRYGIAYYTNYNGWQNTTQFFTTPEGALEDFIRHNRSVKEDDWTPKYYTVYEVTLQIPEL